MRRNHHGSTCLPLAFCSLGRVTRQRSYRAQHQWQRTFHFRSPSCALLPHHPSRTAIQSMRNWHSTHQVRRHRTRIFCPQWASTRAGECVRFGSAPCRFPRSSSPPSLRSPHCLHPLRQKPVQCRRCGCEMQAAHSDCIHLVQRRH